MKLYIITRRDLTTSQQAVQAGHAVAEYLLNNQNEWQNTTLIYLGVSNKRRLNKLKYRLKTKGIEYTSWCEPDLNNEVTAIAAYSDGRIFKDMNLL